jgi:small GTP-binding protein
MLSVGSSIEITFLRFPSNCGNELLNSLRKGVTEFQNISLKSAWHFCENETSKKEVSEENTVKECKIPKKEYWIKVVVVGDGGVGKTSLLNRYISSEFMECMKLTVGADFFTQVFDCNACIIKLQLWDFGGEPRFRFLLPDYCKGAYGVILAFDLTDYTTLHSIDKWMQIIKENTRDPVLILVGTKADIADFLDEEVIKQFCIVHEIDEFIPTSSKTGENVDFVFHELITRIVARKMSSGDVKNV